MPKTSKPIEPSTTPPGKWRKQQLLRLVSSNLTHEQVRVGAFFIAVIDPSKASRSILQSEIIEAVHIRQTNLSRAIRALRAKGFLKVDTKGRTNRYRLTPPRNTTDD